MSKEFDSVKVVNNTISKKIHMENELESIKESMKNKQKYIQDFQIKLEVLMEENKMLKNKSIEKDNELKELYKTFENIMLEISPLFKDLLKMDPSFCFVKDYSQKLFIGQEGFIIVEGRNKTKDINFSSEKVTAEFKKGDKILKQPYKVTFKENEATISFKMAFVGVQRVTLYLDGEQIGDSESEVKISGMERCKFKN
jgi:hypothetical protein